MHECGALPRSPTRESHCGGQAECRTPLEKPRLVSGFRRRDGLRAAPKACDVGPARAGRWPGAAAAPTRRLNARSFVCPPAWGVASQERPHTAGTLAGIAPSKDG